MVLEDWGDSENVANFPNDEEWSDGAMDVNIVETIKVADHWPENHWKEPEN
jgi:hypothetical protein